VSLIGTPCVIVRRVAGEEIDDYGDPVATEELVETVCELQQRQRDEPEAEGEFGVSRWEAFFPVNTEIDTTDGLIVEPHGEFEVIGNPWNANQGSAAVNHVVATLRRVGDVEEAS
jgi:hypothetical protein